MDRNGSHGRFMPARRKETQAASGVIPQNDDASRSVDAFVSRWEPAIQREARRAAFRANASSDEAEDFAQAARLRVAQVALRRPDATAPYVMQVVRNAVRRAVRGELRALGTLSPNAAEIDVDATAASAPNHTIGSVREWLASEPRRLRQLYELLYVFGYTQREAATMLGLSQPRVAQLHRNLLAHGRASLADLAA